MLQLVFLVLVGMLWLSAFEDSPQQQGSHVNPVCMHSAEVFRLVVWENLRICSCMCNIASCFCMSYGSCRTKCSICVALLCGISGQIVTVLWFVTGLLNFYSAWTNFKFSPTPNLKTSVSLFITCFTISKFAIIWIQLVHIHSIIILLSYCFPAICCLPYFPEQLQHVLS